MEPPSNHETQRQEKKAEEALAKLEINSEVRENLSAALSLEKERTVHHMEYLNELRELQSKYEQIYAPLYQSRHTFIKEIPDFWLTVLKNHALVSSFIHEKDERLLKFLTDIRCQQECNSDNFTLEFEFTENPYIRNRILSKRYIMAASEEMERAEGTEIDWTEENFTQKAVKAKRKGKKGKEGVKFVDCESFFNFFKSVNMPGENQLDGMNESFEEELRDSLEEDYDLASEIRDDIVPNALLFYLELRKDESDSESESDKEQPIEEKPTKIDGSGNEQSQCKTQ